MYKYIKTTVHIHANKPHLREYISEIIGLDHNGVRRLFLGKPFDTREKAAQYCKNAAHQNGWQIFSKPA